MKRGQRFLLGVLIVAGFGVAFPVAFLSGPRHDYGAFLVAWNNIMQFQTTWIDINAYGPLFNALAPLTCLHPLAPKMLFCLAWLLATYCIVRFSLAKQPKSKWLPFALVLFFLAGPYFWIEIAWFGHFDILAAIACLAALHCRLQDRDRASGMVLAIGTLLKIFPIVMLPFLMMDGRRLRLRLGIWCSGLTALGLLAAWVIWGTSAFHPFAFAATREPKVLSIFAFLASPYSPLKLLNLAEDANCLAMPALGLAGLALLVTCYRARIDPATGSILAILTTLTFYKVGHPQFLMVLFVLIPYWYVQNWRELCGKLSLHLTLACYLGWITQFVVLYVSCGSLLTEPWIVLRHLGGLPTILLALAATREIYRAGRCVRRCPGQPEPRRLTANASWRHSATNGSQYSRAGR